MSIAEQITQLKQDFDEVKRAGYDEGYEKGIAEGCGDDSFGDVFQDGGNRVNYKYACAGAGWNLELLKKAIKHPIVFPQEASVTMRRNMGMFYYLNIGGTDLMNMTEICERIDFSGCKTATRLFQNAKAKNITVDLSGCETLDNTFSTGDGGAVDFINLKVSENAIFGDGTPGALSTFNNPSITEIRFLEGSVIGNSIKFTSAELTAESVTSIIDTLMTITDDVARTIQFHQDVRDKLTPTQEDTIVNVKKWTLLPARTVTAE